MWSILQNLYTEVSALNRSFRTLPTLLPRAHSRWSPQLIATAMVQAEKYVPPDWALSLSYIPSTYIKLAQRPTPIQTWNLPGVPDGYHVSIKRDDMTGSTLSGNKVRMLEFLLAEAVRENCDCVVAGGLQSNFARIVGVACRQVGLESHLLLHCPGDKDPSRVQCNGNLLLNRLVGTHIVLVTAAGYQGKQTENGYIPGLNDKTESYASKLKSMGRKPYLMTWGGSNVVGIWGYIEAFRELQDQGICEHFDDLIFAMGSGGTATGMAIGNYLTGSKLRIHSVIINNMTLEKAYESVDRKLKLMGLAVNSRDIIHITDRYTEGGYASYSDQDAEQLISIAATTGIVLDLSYTNKAVKGLLNELRVNPTRFKGKRILYIHTGGIFGLYDQRINEAIKQHELTNRISSFSQA